MKLPERKFTTHLAELSLLTAWHLVTLSVVTSNKLNVAATKGLADSDNVRMDTDRLTPSAVCASLSSFEQQCQLY